MSGRVSSLLSLLLVAASAASGSASGYGPWRLGMTPEEVRAVTELGPYQPVASTGGLETRNARFEGKKITASFVFGAGGLYHIQLWAYEGEDYASAVKALHRVYKYLLKEYGALRAGGEPLPAGLSRRQLERRIPDGFRSNDPQLDRLRKTGKIEAEIQRFHLYLKREPPDVRIYASLIHSPQLGLYYVFLYFKSPDDPRRDRRTRTLGAPTTVGRRGMGLTLPAAPELTRERESSRPPSAVGAAPR